MSTVVVVGSAVATSVGSGSSSSSKSRMKHNMITILIVVIFIGWIDVMNETNETAAVTDVESSSTIEIKTKQQQEGRNDDKNNDHGSDDSDEVAQLQLVPQQQQQQQQQPANIEIEEVHLPLTYPFRIIQYGQPRSGSTFQYELLKAIMYLKSPDDIKFPKDEYYNSMNNKNDNNKNNENLILKVHDIHSLRKELKRDSAAASDGGGAAASAAAGGDDGDTTKPHPLSIFASGDVLYYNNQVDNVKIVSNATPAVTTTITASSSSSSSGSYLINAVKIPIVQLFDENDNDDDVAAATSSSHYHPIYHHQLKRNLYNCSLCEVDYYRPLFNLTNEDITILKEYMMYYQILRQCCGFQMSKYNLYRIHNCNVTKYKELPEYPNCESHNITFVETQFAYHQPIPYMSLNPKLLWNVPGDCEKYDTEIVTQNLHNNNHKIKFKGCP